MVGLPLAARTRIVDGRYSRQMQHKCGTRCGVSDNRADDDPNDADDSIDAAACHDHIDKHDNDNQW